MTLSLVVGMRSWLVSLGVVALGCARAPAQSSRQPIPATLTHVCVAPDPLPHSPDAKSWKPDGIGVEAVADKDARWKGVRALRVRFLGKVAPEVAARVERAARPWSESAGIDFVFDGSDDAEIRIAMLYAPGSWSHLGNQARRVAKHKPTMVLGALDADTPEDKFNSVVRHEFGHALGLVHEHQNPSSPIRWKEEAVYNYYTGAPLHWTRKRVRDEILERFSKSETNYTTFDERSVMIYAIPPELTVDGYTVGWNAELSPFDRCLAAQLYRENGQDLCPSCPCDAALGGSKAATVGAPSHP